MGAAVQGEGREAGTAEGHPRTDAAGSDRGRAGVVRLRVELQDPIASFIDPAGRADDALKGESRLQGGHIQSIRIDGCDVHGVGRGSEIRAANDDGGAGNVGGGDLNAAGTDSQHAELARAGGGSGAEGVDLEVSIAAAVVVEDEASQGVVPEKIQGAPCTVDGDDVASINGTRCVQGHRSIAQDQAVRRRRRERNEARGKDVQRALIHGGAARVGVGTRQIEGVYTRLHQGVGSGDDAIDDVVSGSLGIDEEFGA